MKNIVLSIFYQTFLFRLSPKVFILSPFFIFSFCFEVTGQFMILDSESRQEIFEIDLIQEKLNQLEIIDKPSNFISNAEVKLIDGELQIGYQLKPFKGITAYYEVFLHTKFKKNQDEASIVLPTRIISGDIGKIDRNLDIKKMMVWSNLIACLPASKGILEIDLTVKLWGERILQLGVQCNNPPVFGIKQQAPYISSGLVGLGGIIAASLFKGKANRSFDDHIESTIIADRNDFYNQYKKNLNRSEVLYFSSLGLLAIDAFLFLRRKKLHSRRLEIFEKNCAKNSFQIFPQFGIGGQSEGFVQSNILLKVTF